MALCPNHHYPGLDTSWSWSSKSLCFALRVVQIRVSNKSSIKIQKKNLSKQSLILGDSQDYSVCVGGGCYVTLWVAECEKEGEEGEIVPNKKI